MPTLSLSRTAPGTFLYEILLPTELLSSSDAHMGDTEMEVGSHGLIQFRGRRLARAAVQQLVGERQHQHILFGGCSAGVWGGGPCYSNIIIN